MFAVVVRASRGWTKIIVCCGFTSVSLWKHMASVRSLRFNLFWRNIWWRFSASKKNPDTFPVKKSQRYRNQSVLTSCFLCFFKGCDTGFGNATAKHLDALGFEVFATVLDLSGDGARDLQRTCSPRLTLLQVDITQPQQVQQALLDTKAKLGLKGKDRYIYTFLTTQHAVCEFHQVNKILDKLFKELFTRNYPQNFMTTGWKLAHNFFETMSELVSNCFCSVSLKFSPKFKGRRWKLVNNLKLILDLTLFYSKSSQWSVAIHHVFLWKTKNIVWEIRPCRYGDL